MRQPCTSLGSPLKHDPLDRDGELGAQWTRSCGAIGVLEVGRVVRASHEEQAVEGVLFSLLRGHAQDALPSRRCGLAAIVAVVCCGSVVSMCCDEVRWCFGGERSSVGAAWCNWCCGCETGYAVRWGICGSGVVAHACRRVIGVGSLVCGVRGELLRTVLYVWRGDVAVIVLGVHAEASALGRCYGGTRYR